MQRAQTHFSSTSPPVPEADKGVITRDSVDIFYNECDFQDRS